MIKIDPSLATRNSKPVMKNNNSGQSSDNQSNVEIETGKKQRSQKEVLNLIRNRNKKGKGPFLRRSDTMHIKIVNVTKSIGFDMQMVNLAGIDNMMTNFN